MTTRTAIWCATTLFILACSQVGTAAESLEFYGFDPETQSEESREGLEAIFSGNIFHQALPVTAYRLVVLTQFRNPKLGYNADSPEGRFFATGRLPSPPNRTVGMDKGIPLGVSMTEREGAPMVSINCFECHAGVVRGTVVAGLGHSHINQSEPNRPRTRGDNFGPYAVWQFGSRLEDPANKGLTLAKGRTELTKLFHSTPLPTVDPMPWYLMKYKEKDYWYADGGPSDAAHFSINFSTPHDKLNENRAEHVAIVAKALAFARATTSPPYPGKLDPDKVLAGADLFHGRSKPARTEGFVTCKNCHGSYTRKESATDLTQPGGWNVDYKNSHIFRNVKTDDAYNTTLQTLAPIAEHLKKLETYYTKLGTPELIPHESAVTKKGYVAPPLVGVWASAPYFHNGSVPTVEAVLDSSKRPEIWARNNTDPTAYDLKSVGLDHRVLSPTEWQEIISAAAGTLFVSKEAVAQSTVYDTTAFGHRNVGHTFGDHLTEEERFAIIEFLKSLSGPDM